MKRKLLCARLIFDFDNITHFGSKSHFFQVDFPVFIWDRVTVSTKKIQFVPKTNPTPFIEIVLRYWLNLSNPNIHRPFYFNYFYCPLVCFWVLAIDLSRAEASYTTEILVVLWISDTWNPRLADFQKPMPVMSTPSLFWRILHITNKCFMPND